jgi:NAD-dependent DNA ligase
VSTQGDGKQGQDVTTTILQMMNIPTTLLIEQDDVSDVLEIWGEAVLPRSSFKELSAQAPTTKQWPFPMLAMLHQGF